MAAPVLGGVTLAQPTGYENSTTLQGAGREMADGSIAIDIVSPGAVGTYRQTYKLEWTLITNTEANTIETQYWAMVDAMGTSNTVFTPPTGSSVNVQAMKSPAVERKAVKMAGGTLRYNVKIELKRV